MSNKPYRLAQGGSRIDRTKKVQFSFDGKQLSGFAGDTLASAVMANGTKLFGRSFKYHRPRGVVGLGSEEMNALVGVGDGSRHEPNLRATQVELFDGLAGGEPEPLAVAGLRCGFTQQHFLALHSRRLLLQDLHVAAAFLETCV